MSGKKGTGIGLPGENAPKPVVPKKRTATPPRAPPAPIAKVEKTTGASKLPGKATSNRPTPEPSGFRSERASVGSSSVTSEDSTLTTQSVPSIGPRGKTKNRIQKKTRVVIKGTSDGKWRTLMLASGQGGTFGCGSCFKQEGGSWVGGVGSNPNPAKIKHLTKFGNGIEYIGTRNCATCLGVYFELSGCRVFCAHINAWHSGSSYNVRDLDPIEDEKIYKEIRDAVFKRMEAHAGEHGWTKKDIDFDTLTLVSPWPEATGYAIADGVCIDFLGYKKLPQIHPSHGFVMKPGRRTSDKKLVGAILKTEWREADDGLADLICHVPEQLEEKFYELNHIPVKREWCYTHTVGWHEIEENTSRFPGGKFEDDSKWVTPKTP